MACNENVEIIQQLLKAEFERRMQGKVREKLNEERKEYEKQAESLNAAVARLRIIYKTEFSYKDMLIQVEEIEDGEKNGLCQKNNKTHGSFSLTGRTVAGDKRRVWHDTFG